MDPNGHIYFDEPEKIPAADKARLDGYLRARAEMDTATRLQEQKEKLERELASARAITRGPKQPRSRT
jgi:hypothetical protein